MALSNCSKIAPGLSFWPQTITANALLLKPAKWQTSRIKDSLNKNIFMFRNSGE